MRLAIDTYTENERLGWQHEGRQFPRESERKLTENDTHMLLFNNSKTPLRVAFEPAPYAFKISHMSDRLHTLDWYSR